jgi:hypothetical protein
MTSQAFFNEDRLFKTLQAYIRALQIMFKYWDEYKWDEDENKTKIIITKSMPIDVKRSTEVPAISVSINNAQFAGTSMNQFQRQSAFTFEDTRLYSDIILGSTTIVCISTNDIVTRTLGWTVFNIIPLFRNYIQQLSGADYIDHRPSISTVFDAAQFIKNAQPGVYFGIQVLSGFRIKYEQPLPRTAVYTNIIKELEIEINKNKS